jgi:hypothetical protein
MAGRDGNLRVGSTRGVSRRGFLQTAAGGAAGLALSRWAAPESALAAPPPFNPNANPITRENRLSPSGSWRNDFRFGTGKYQPDVTGFATKTSVNAGELLPIKLNVYGHGGATTVDLQIFRLGYYGGAGGRLIATQTGIPVTDQGFLPLTDALGYTTAANVWSPTVTINTTGYETGMYLIKIVANPADFPGLGNENHIPFIVRADGRARDLLVVMPTNTWQAYNAWGGKSIYVYNSSERPTVIGAKGTGPYALQERAAKVSFDRPMTNVIAEYNWVLRTEFPLIWWLERQGYNLTYTDDLGVHSQPAELRPPLTKTVAIAGHSEYWTKEMRDNMEAARDAGANIASFSANTAYWQVRLENAGRSLVCFKTVQSRDVNTADAGADGVNDFGPDNTGRGASDDPLGSDGRQGGVGDNPGLVTTTFRDAGVAPPPQAGAPDNARPVGDPALNQEGRRTPYSASCTSATTTTSPTRSRCPGARAATASSAPTRPGGTPRSPATGAPSATTSWAGSGTRYPRGASTPPSPAASRPGLSGSPRPFQRRPWAAISRT